MKNVELIARTLEQAGVRWVFGVPSGPVLPLIEALSHSDVQYVLTASETSAGFMATTVGVLTGVPGVCVATLGPGATNLATGVGAAWLDRAPIVAITCNVSTPLLDRRVQMRIDHHALFSPLTKASLPLRESNVGQQLAAALAGARAEPPGPVHLDLPEDVSLAVAPETKPIEMPSSPPEDRSSEQVAILAEALARSRRPLVLTGLTFTRARPAARARLLDLIERLGIPFVSTMHAKGFLPESHPNWAGVLGRARRSTVQAFIDRADLIVAVGYDPIEINYEEWVGRLPVVHLSDEPADADRSVHVTNAVGPLDTALERLAEVPSSATDWSPDEIADHRRRLGEALRPPSQQLATYQVLDRLRARLPADAILAYDVGAHTHQIASQWQTDLPNTCLSTNGWSSMGFGIPAAYAAKLAEPRRTVVGVVGDGCFQMTVGELALARRHNLAVPIIVLNDGWLGLIKVKQERKGYDLSGVSLGGQVDPPAHYFGVPVRAARTPGELDGAIEWALALDGPSVIDAQVDVALYSQTVYD